MGKGNGNGTGHGTGYGEGRGNEVNDTNMAIGGTIAVVLTVFMCVCGLPMLFAGVAFIMIFNSWETSMYGAGIALIVISVVLLVVGVIFIILFCTGAIGSKTNRTRPTVHTTTVVMARPPPYQSGPPPGYPGHTPAHGYGQFQAQGYGQAPPPPQGYGQQPPVYGHPGVSTASSNDLAYPPPPQPAYPPNDGKRY